ncbi:bifunctional enoyl-CoA hydratase/phosphate acetyltransferase [Oceanimonas sp. NS1]|uniref:bifunctional enoyl-CoA hydratase/phosphate acetyltransferase n=1 Tax=Oceanimonas sp. MB9 TaxID=2588453 RepID=UPI0013F5FDF3|nr:bifunctional enoyl-CoA hydratase/phosphate acetyltransferase [Oceanimonas sp. MB9]MCT7654026.1 bifunctional enoyl-CoA hydratase/phosphate acetyltransferase [Oceanimonas sp. NS1]NHH99692.1 Phosphate acetyltransferase [Oceanimonas sp. MB9]
MLNTNPKECPAHLLAQARQYAAVTTVVINPVNQVSLASARMAQDEGLIEPILVGDESRIRHEAETLGWDLAGVRLVHAADEAAAAQAGVALVSQGEADAIMKGHVHTDVLLRAVLNRAAGLRTDSRLSHVFYMTVPGSCKALCITDAVINVQPGVLDKLHIARNAIEFLHALGCDEPKVAVLSGTEEVSRSMPSSQDAAELVKLAAMGALPGAVVEGPLAFDNAVSREAAAIKGIAGRVPGEADILLVPNLESGNFLFKQMVYFMGATAAGLVLGARVPIILTSRADPPEARLASCALASIVHHNRQTPVAARAAAAERVTA